jgi:threonine synthase
MSERAVTSDHAEYGAGSTTGTNQCGGNASTVGKADWALVCDACGERVAASAVIWRCPCGGALDLLFAGGGLLDGTETLSGLWRYRAAFPPIPDEDVVTLGEGQTPLIDARNRAGVKYKLDYLFPTGSFKDRGSTVIASCLNMLGVTRAVEDSSGNAGASMAAYFAAAGITATIFVPATTSLAKAAQIRAFGAQLVPVAGSRAEVTQAAQDAAGAGFYASHLWSPYFLAGTMTFAFEIWEQLGGRPPDRVVVPVGGGTLLLGAYLGFRHLRALGFTERIPTLVGVQAEQFAPLHRAFEEGRDSPADSAFTEGETAAEGIRLRHPPRSRQILRAVRETGGRIETVTEADIRRAWTALARQGLYVEPTAAVAAAATERLMEREPLTPGSVTVTALTGSGLKGVAGMVDGVGIPSGKE